jgi:RNA ligase
MIADLSKLDGSDSFMVHPHQVAGETVLLCQPTFIGARWTEDTMIFRSSVWNLKGEPVSLSYKKFFNLGEHPELTPVPNTLKGAEPVAKIDGSTLLISKYKNHLIVRTRGTVDARKQENGYEIDYLIQKYPLVFDNAYVNSGNATVICEWCTPTNRVVLDYGPEPLLYLTGIIQHADYRMVRQNTLDVLAPKWNVLRPATFHYDSIEEMKSSMEAMRGQEGVCLYYNEGQNILKIKSAFYLFLHRAKSEVASIEKVIDLYLDVFLNSNSAFSPTYTEFMDYLTKTFDYEIAQMAIPNVSQICDAMKEVSAILNSMIQFVAPLKSVPRRDAALKIIQAYGDTSRSGFAFKMLDSKKLDADAYKKLLFQCLKA